MTLVHAARLTGRRTGTYIAIFASTYICFYLAGLMAEQMGVSVSRLSKGLVLASAVLVSLVGLLLPADDSREFYTAGRNVSPYFSGLSVAMTAVGGTGVICLTGALFKLGMDALVPMIGWVTGIVFAGVLLFPFLRKCGAYSVASFLGLRLDSRFVRMVSAGILIVPTLLVLAAEIRVGAFVASWISGYPEAATIVFVATLASTAVVVGGMRAFTWTSSTQAIAAILAIVVPATIVSLLISNLPVPQMMHGTLLRAYSRNEFAQAYPILQSSVIAFQMPGAGLEPFTGPFLQSFSHVGRLSAPFAILTIAFGLAGLPGILNRAGTSQTTYDARKAMGWAVLNTAFLLVTLASIAGFLRCYLIDQIASTPGDRLPIWFQSLQQLGAASVGKTREAIAMSAIAMKRDAAFIALPMAAGLPVPLVALAAAGALAAALAGASAHILALGGLISEDLLHGGRREPPEEAARLWSARIGVVAAGGAGIVVAFFVSDPLAAVLAALALSAATIFPVLLLSILWRKVSRLGAIGGMLAGGGTTLALILASMSGVMPVAPVLAGAVGVPVNLLVMVLLSEASPSGNRRALEVVRDVRIPGGEAVYDREMRLLRRKRASPGL